MSIAYSSYMLAPVWEYSRAILDIVGNLLPSYYIGTYNIKNSIVPSPVTLCILTYEGGHPILSRLLALSGVFWSHNGKARTVRTF